MEVSRLAANTLQKFKPRKLSTPIELPYYMGKRLALDETSLRAAIVTAKGHLRMDYRLEQMMGGFLPDMVRGEERWCWTKWEKFGLETDRLQSLCDRPPEGYVGVARSWWASDAFGHCSQDHPLGDEWRRGGVVFGEAPPTIGADGSATRLAALQRDCISRHCQGYRSYAQLAAQPDSCGQRPHR
eukprot:COSAG03_NODE_210_length_10594_cov_32.990472_11_plen_185_part_00